MAMRRRQDEPGAKKRCVEYSTFLKWKRDLDREYQTMSWLDSDSETDSGKKVVYKLKLSALISFVCMFDFSVSFLIQIWMSLF